MKILKLRNKTLTLHRIKYFLKAYSYIIAFLGFLLIFLLCILDTFINYNLLPMIIGFSIIPFSVILLDVYLNNHYEL